MSQASPGLRDLKKQITRRAIADAALQAALERGVERVRLEEIAAQAFVSPRTVSNYFSGKEEAIATAGRDLQDTILEDLARRPADEPPLVALHRVVVDFVRSLTPEELDAQRQKRLLGERYPGINAYLMARYESVEELLRAPLAIRIGPDDDQDLRAWLIAAAAVAAVRVSVTRWVRSGADVEELLSMLDTAFAHLRDGLEIPRPASGGGASATRRRRPRARD